MNKLYEQKLQESIYKKEFERRVIEIIGKRLGENERLRDYVLKFSKIPKNKSNEALIVLNFKKVQNCLNMLYGLYEENWKIYLRCKKDKKTFDINAMYARAKAYKAAYEYVKNQIFL